MQKKLRLQAKAIVSPTAGIIENGSVVIDKGIIQSIDHGVGTKKVGKEELLDYPSLFVYPGFIESHGHITVVGESTGSINNDGNDPYDSITPQLRIADAINLDSNELKTARNEGILAVGIFPGSANLIGGMGSVIRTTCDSLLVEDAIVREDIGMKMAFGENPKRVFSSDKKFYTRMGALGFLRDYFTAVLNYRKKKESSGKTGKKKGSDKKGSEKTSSNGPDLSLKYEMGLRLLNREFPARAHAHQANDIQNAVKLAREFGFDVIIEHATEADLIADFIKQNNVPLVIGPIGSPGMKIETRRRRLESPGELSRMGILTALMTDAPVVNISMLRICAGLTIKAGMDYFEALKAITLNAARICRIEDRYGDITPGKEAHLVVWDGDPLRDIAARVVAIVDGETIIETTK